MDNHAQFAQSDSVLADFARRLGNPDLPHPSSLSVLPGQTIKRRFAVYQNNVAVGLVNALGDNFPTVKNLVGEEYFRAMARVYASGNLPRSPLMFGYGDQFPNFLTSFKPAQNLFFLPDVARLERLWLDSWNEADAEILTSQALSQVTPEILGDLRFINHPASRVFSSQFAAVSIMTKDRKGETLADINPNKPEDALITRPECDVVVRFLPTGGYTFLESLMSGNSLGEAAVAALEQAKDFDLAAAISTILEAGVFSGIKTRNH